MISRSWLFIVMGCLCAVASAEVRYSVTKLGPGYVADLNNKGVAVLYFVEGGRPVGPAYLWEGSQLRFLPLSSLPARHFTSLVWKENDKGQLAGWVDNGTSLTSPEYENAEAAFWDHGADQPPIILGKTTEVGFISGLNESGHLLIERRDHRVAMWSADAGYTLLPDPGGASSAAAINDSDVVIGGYTTPDRLYHAVMWKDGQFQQLDSGPWLISGADAIANDGTIAGTVGNGWPSPRQLAIWSSSGALQTFEFPGGASGGVYAINSAHQILVNAGPVYLFENGTFTPLQDLVPSGESLNWTGNGIAMNDAGQILLTREVRTGPSSVGSEAVLLTPIPPMIRALSIAGGLRAATGDDIAMLAAAGSGSVSLTDAVRLARKAAGIE